MNATYQHLISADDVNLWGTNVYTANESTEASLVATKETVLKLNAEKMKYMPT